MKQNNNFLPIGMSSNDEYKRMKAKHYTVHNDSCLPINMFDGYELLASY